jgi:endonuclease YncB( thermonuclease family)
MPRRFRRRRRLLWLCSGAVALLIVARVGGERWFPTFWRAANSTTTPLSRPAAFVAGPVKVLRVATGDTLVVVQEVSDSSTGSKTTIQDELRLLGIRTPEDGPYREAAAAFAREAVSGDVRIELDKRRVNRFGQFLAYVYVDDRLLNAELLGVGLARLDPYPGDNLTHARNFKRAKQEAERAGRGIWAVGQASRLPE